MRKKVENLPRLVQAEDWHYQPRAALILAAMTGRIYWGVPRKAVRPRTLTEVTVCDMPVSGEPGRTVRVETWRSRGFWRRLVDRIRAWMEGEKP